MIRRASIILLVSLLLVSVLAFGTFAAQNKKGVTSGAHALKGGKAVDKALAYSFADETKGYPNSGKLSVTPSSVPIGQMVAAGSAESPGVIFGNTWYDYQHNCSMGRMIECGPHTGEVGYTIVHMGWMYIPDNKINVSPRSYAYNAYFSQDHSMVGQTILMDPELEYAGYVNVDVTPDNRAIVGGHNRPAADANGYSSEMRFDGGPGYATFPNVIRVPDSVQKYAQNDPTEYAIWPKFFFQFGTDTVMHVASQVADNDQNSQALMYFRKAGFEGSTDTEWDYPPYVVDSVQDIAQDIIGQRTGDRVCMVWFASLPYQEPFCDTCSGITVYDGYLVGQMDNDIYYQESLDQGVTWEPRVNMTQCEIGAAGYKAYCDASVLYDSEENLHIIWHACPWPADLCWDEGGFCWSESWYIDNARLMHWSENVPYIRPIADQVYEVRPELWDSCYAGAWALRIAKPTISECDGKLYTIWTQFNNPKEGLIDDCAAWGYETSDPAGAPNGDIWVSVSADWGMTWDYQRNLTNSYTPRCDPRWAENCQSDYWASMSRTGRAVQTSTYPEDWSGAVVVDPSGGSYAGSYYLDIQYVNDMDAGGIVVPEGTWTDNPMKWFRIPCVDPIPLPIFAADWTALGDPNYVKPGESMDTILMLENIGNVELTYTMDIVYDDGSSGWLGTSGFSGTIPSGLYGYENGTITLNQNLMTAYGNYYAHLHMEGNDPNNMPFDIGIELIIADTIIGPYWDSLMTSCLGLMANNYGNFGRGGTGELNMDYVRLGDDCDTNANVYLYDGSSFVGWIEGVDTLFYSSIWGASYTDYNAWRPQGGEFTTKECGGFANFFHSGTMTDQDSLIGISKIYAAPSSGDCNFIIEYMKVWSYDGLAHNDLVIGEGIDWDIPTDYLVEDTAQQNGSCNYGGVDGSRDLVYCQGYDAHGLGNDTLYPYNCQFNDERFGGNAFIESYVNGSLYKTYAERGIVGTNDTLQANSGWLEGPLYQELTYTTGFSATDSIVDLNTVMAFETAFDLGASDVYEAVTVLVSIQQGTVADLQAAVDAANAWYTANGGMSMFEDVDETPGQADICAGCCMTIGKFYQDGQPFSILDVDNFTEWLLRNPGVPSDYDCLEEVDVSGATPGVPDGVVSILDLDFMIGYLLRGDVPSLGACP